MACHRRGRSLAMCSGSLDVVARGDRDLLVMYTVKSASLLPRGSHWAVGLLRSASARVGPAMKGPGSIRWTVGVSKRGHAHSRRYGSAVNNAAAVNGGPRFHTREARNRAFRHHEHVKPCPRTVRFRHCEASDAVAISPRAHHGILAATRRPAGLRRGCHGASGSSQRRVPMRPACSHRPPSLAQPRFLVCAGLDVQAASQGWPCLAGSAKV